MIVAPLDAGQSLTEGYRLVSEAQDYVEVRPDGLTRIVEIRPGALV